MWSLIKFSSTIGILAKFLYLTVSNIEIFKQIQSMVVFDKLEKKTHTSHSVALKAPFVRVFFFHSTTQCRHTIASGTNWF